MNKACKSENIETLIKEVMPECQIDKNYIYGFTQPGLMASIMYNTFQFLVASDYYIVYITSDNIIIIIPYNFRKPEWKVCNEFNRRY